MSSLKCCLISYTFENFRVDDDENINAKNLNARNIYIIYTLESDVEVQLVSGNQCFHLNLLISGKHTLILVYFLTFLEPYGH